MSKKEESAITLEAINLIVSAPDANDNYVMAEIESQGEGENFRQRHKKAYTLSDSIMVTSGEIPTEIIDKQGIIETVPAGETANVLLDWRVRFRYTHLHPLDHDDYTANTYTMDLKQRTDNG